jgi:uncharacterized lipoprotein YbaY
MGIYLWRTENVAVNPAGVTFTHGLGVAPAGEFGEVFIRHRTATVSATVLSSSTAVVVLACRPDTMLGGITVDLCVMAFHSIIR